MTSQLIGHRDPVYNITILNCTLFPHNCTQLGDETHQLPRTILNTSSAFTSVGYCSTCFLNSSACAVGSCAHTIYTTISEAVLRYTYNGIKTLRSRWTLGRVCTTNRYLTGLRSDCRELVSPRIEIRTNMIYQEYSVNIFEHFQQVRLTCCLSRCLSLAASHTAASLLLPLSLAASHSAASHSAASLCCLSLLPLSSAPHSSASHPSSSLSSIPRTER